MTEKKKHSKTIYFIGIGGIGMSALALYYHQKDFLIKGYDKTPSPITEDLQNKGIDIIFEDDSNHLPEKTDAVVYTPAVPKDLALLLDAKKRGIPVLKRAEALGIISKRLQSIAIAGTHGKTTITSILAHILYVAGEEILSLIGGISKNYNSNLILTENPQKLIVEADEYDRSFLNLFPDKAIISAMDADHLDIYGTKEELHLAFQSFANQIKPNGTLLIFDELKNVFSTIVVKKYGFSEKADYRIDQLRIENGAYIFNIVNETETISDFKLSIGGKHNVINAAAAIAMAKEEGIENEIIKKAIASYTGVKRRFEKIYEGKQRIFIDDYAHHPEELKYTIQSVKDLYPGKKICGIFQPHLFSRTQDLADDFAQSLALLDSLILLEIYPAREEAIPGINAAFLLEKVKLKDKQILKKDEICYVLKERNDDIILTLGAGDIDRLVNPIYKTLKAKEDE